ncbi:MAG: HAD family hydrolase [Acidimicrobiia bacterium]|nr:HAD family hydrolase [Acidimicrobiia bacterium]
MVARCRAVTFDFWNTLVRLEPAVPGERSRHLAAVLRAHGEDTEPEVVDGALGHVRERFDEQWRANRQYVLADAVDDLLRVVGVGASPELTAALRQRWLESGRAQPVALTEPGVVDVVDELRRSGLAVGIVCDSGLIPGSVLRGHLERLGLADHIDHSSFSDEVGVYKPDSAIFADAFGALDADADAVVHVGDLYRTDIVGARAAGAAAIRYRGVVDDPEAPDGDEGPVIGSLRELSALICD